MNRSKARATATLPIVAGWKCSKCGAYNAKEGTITVSSSVPLQGSTKQALDSASKKLDATWADRCISIMQRPKDYGLYHEGTVKINGKCIDCGNKEVWSAKDEMLSRLFQLICIGLPLIAIPFIIIDLMDKGTSPLRGIIAIAIGICLFTIALREEKVYKNKFNSLNDSSIPTMATFNEEVLERARNRGIDLFDEVRADTLLKGFEYKKTKK